MQSRERPRPIPQGALELRRSLQVVPYWYEGGGPMNGIWPWARQLSLTRSQFQSGSQLRGGRHHRGGGAELFPAAQALWACASTTGPTRETLGDLKSRKDLPRKGLAFEMGPVPRKLSRTSHALGGCDWLEMSEPQRPTGRGWGEVRSSSICSERGGEETVEVSESCGDVG